MLWKGVVPEPSGDSPAITDLQQDGSVLQDQGTGNLEESDSDRRGVAMAARGCLPVAEGNEVGKGLVGEAEASMKQPGLRQDESGGHDDRRFEAPVEEEATEFPFSCTNPKCHLR